MENSLKIAQFLENHSFVERVIHPGQKTPLFPFLTQIKSNLTRKSLLRAGITPEPKNRREADLRMGWNVVLLRERRSKRKFLINQ